jgi:predicted TIM-barrel fold metal-dependent hydrolase
MTDMNEIEKGLQTPKIDTHCHVFRSHDWAESADHLITCSDRLGITENWCSSPIIGGVLGSVEEVRIENEAILSSMARHPGRIRGLCFVIPGPDAISEIERCLDAGMIGIKLYNQYRINDPIVRPIIELTIERRVPILEHAGYPSPDHKGGQPLISNGDHFAEVNERYPDAIIYHAHMGGGGDWEYTIKALRDGSPNLYIDISGSNLDYDQVGFAVNELGAERVLFGTDGTMAGSVGKAIEADITEDERHLIWWGNAERILAAQGLSPTPPTEESTARTSPKIGPIDTASAPCPSAPLQPIDLNTWLGSYPFRSVTATPESLIARMDRFGIPKSAVSSIEAAFHRNVQPANDRLFAQVSDHSDRLIPLGTVNPTYSKWEQDLLSCVDQGARGIRIVPQTHGYKLSGPVGKAVIEAIGSTSLPIFIPHRLEDARQKHWLDPGTTVELSEIADVIARYPTTTFVINNSRGLSRSALWTRKDIRNAKWYVDLSLLEIQYGLHRGMDKARDVVVIFEEGGADHFVFGTHQPFSYVASAGVKLATLGLEPEQVERIVRTSALDILGLGDA